MSSTMEIYSSLHQRVFNLGQLMTWSSTSNIFVEVKSLVASRFGFQILEDPRG